MRQQIVNWFQNHPEVSIIGFFLGLILAIWSLIVGIKSKNKKQLTVSLRGNNLIQDFTEKVNGLEVNFKSEKVKNLTVTKIAVWNSGNLTLLSSDIVIADLLRIDADGDTNILDYQVIQSNEASNQFRVVNPNAPNAPVKSLNIEFDYFDSKQGCVIQVLHDSDSSRDIKVNGKLKGIEKIRRLENSTLVNRFSEMFGFTKSRKVNRIISGSICILVSILLPIMLIFFNNKTPVLEESFWPKIFAIFTVVPYLYLGIMILFRRLPKGLDTFDERL